MGFNTKTKAIACIVAVSLILLSSYTDIQINKPSSRFDSIEKTLNYIDELDNRLINTKDNKKLYSELLHYVSGNFPNNETLSQEYDVNLVGDYTFIIESDSQDIPFDSKNSVCTRINTALKEKETLLVADNIDNLKNDENYIYITEDDDGIDELYKYKSIKLVIIKCDELLKHSAVVIEADSGPSVLYINTDIKLHVGQHVSLMTDIQYQQAKLNNIYTTIKNNHDNNAIVITAHYDSTTADGQDYSNGILDNATGVAVVMDMLRKAYENNIETNYDIVFAFVNSNENMIRTENSGSYQLNKLLSQKYEQILNINIDCVGQKDAESITYGTTGRVSSSLIQNFVINNIKSNTMRIDRSVVNYNSDNMSFVNSVYFYSMNENDGSDVIHTENDNLDAVDIEKVQIASDLIYRVLKDIAKTSPSKLFKFY